MDNEPAEIIHPKFRMWLRPDGIVQLVWVTAAVMSLEDALAATEAMTRLTGGRRCPLLVDAHDAGRGDLVSAVGVIVATPLSRLTGNFFIVVSKPMPPTRLFDDESSAIAWLGEFPA